MLPPTDRRAFVASIFTAAIGALPGLADPPKKDVAPKKSGDDLPVFPPERIEQTRPAYILILPWNLRDEIRAQLAAARSWGAQFVVPIPRTTILE